MRLLKRILCSVLLFLDVESYGQNNINVIAGTYTINQSKYDEERYLIELSLINISGDTLLIPKPVSEFIVIFWDIAHIKDINNAEKENAVYMLIDTGYIQNVENIFYVPEILSLGKFGLYDEYFRKWEGKNTLTLMNTHDNEYYQLPPFQSVKLHATWYMTVPDVNSLKNKGNKVLGLMVNLVFKQQGKDEVCIQRISLDTKTFDECLHH